MGLAGKHIYISAPEDDDYLVRLGETRNMLQSKGAWVCNPGDARLRFPKWTREQRMTYNMNLLTSNMVFADKSFRNSIDLFASLPGWETSETSILERAVARACGLRVVDWDELEGMMGE